MRILVRRTAFGFDIAKGAAQFRALLDKRVPFEVVELDTGECFVVHEIDGQVVAIDALTHKGMQNLAAVTFKDAALPWWRRWLRYYRVGWVEKFISVVVKAFHAFVIGPALIAAIIFAISYAAAGVRLHDVVRTYYDHADVSLRFAPAGFVLHRECVPSLNEEAHCLQTRVVKVPIATEIENTTRSVATVYFWLVAFSALVLTWRFKSKSKN